LEPPRDLTLHELSGIVDQFSVLERVVLHGIGEPLLNEELARMIRYLKERNPGCAVLFNTNAVLLSDEWQRALIESGLDELRVSLDAATSATYSAIRGIDEFASVTANVERFSRLLQNRGTPRLSLWLTAMRENLMELPRLVDLAADIGVPEVYVQRLVLMHRGLAQQEHSVFRQLQEREKALLVEAAKRASARKVDFRASGLVSPKESLGGASGRRGSHEVVSDRPWYGCYRMWRMTYVTANGNVLPCCISPFSAEDYGDLILGNAFDAPFGEIWNGERYVERRAALHSAHPCHPCELCGVNWSL
jgi:MoaA/NifB/PqqE/SkfB family radical SAM enzyme